MFQFKTLGVVFIGKFEYPWFIIDNLTYRGPLNIYCTIERYPLHT